MMKVIFDRKAETIQDGRIDVPEDLPDGAADAICMLLTGLTISEMADEIINAMDDTREMAAR